ncbi:MAG: serine/threonine-protein kinase [Myxococcales bacterium]|nr:serine/threonine-protein kinase [Myxococcales bacterium]
MAEHKYRVIKRLEAGGMAEVYVGEAVSVQGFKKKVAIKRVLPHLAQNEDFIQMFLDEARLSAKLNHANIVSVFDISSREDTFFLIMEFVDGANLKKIMESLQRRGARMSLAQACYICIEACRGLSYAHELMDESGAPLGIVHRDISPPNIMVTKRGEVKVADFGLAKAGTQLQTTDPGVVKGKFSYLSPEAAQGMEVDARADVFSLGIVLWEMLAGKRLFLGENDYATVKLIQKANIPRLAPLNRDVDMAFEEVLLKALTRNPNSRYQSARDFGDALAGYLYNRQLKVTSYDLAHLVQTATADPTTTTGDQSLIDRLIQDELDESVGIGSSSGTIPARQADSDLMPAAGDLEDPASWFNDDDDLFGGGGGTVEPAAAARPAAPVPPSPPAPKAEPPTPTDSSSSGAWREGGLVQDSPPQGTSLADELEPGDTGEIVLEANTSVPPAPTAQGSAPQSSGGGATKIIIAAIVVLAIAAIAFLGTQL